ncbi:MAG: lysoplasmalogenase [Anaerolineae bacterium]|nr:lysoplasmalogenase [Anaerolineae bacterium]
MPAERKNDLLTWSFFAAIAFAFLDWASTWKGWKIRLYIAKPATLLFLIIWTYQVTRWQGGMIWFGVALLFSLLGDIALMLNPRYFMVGLASFLLAHLSFLIGFNLQPPPLTIGTILMAILVGISVARVLRTLKPGLLKVPRGKRFLAAVVAYGLTLALMVFSALITNFRTDWGVLSAAMCATGAILFYISDTLLGYDRFVVKVKHGQSYVHLTYHLGQIGLVTGAMLHFLNY